MKWLCRTLMVVMACISVVEAQTDRFLRENISLKQENLELKEQLSLNEGQLQTLKLENEKLIKEVERLTMLLEKELKEKEGAINVNGVPCVNVPRQQIELHSNFKRYLVSMAATVGIENPIQKKEMEQSINAEMNSLFRSARLQSNWYASISAITVTSRIPSVIDITLSSEIDGQTVLYTNSFEIAKNPRLYNQAKELSVGQLVIYRGQGLGFSTKLKDGVRIIEVSTAFTDMNKVE